MSQQQSWGIAGGGAWGTALAHALASSGQKVLVWDRDPMVVDDINRHHQNLKRYADLKLHEGIKATASIEEMLEASEFIVVAVPSEANVVVAAQLAPSLLARHTLVIAAKGLRESDGALLTDVWREAVPHVERIAVLGGPTFAREVMEEKMTAMVVAAKDENVTRQISQGFASSWVRVYESPDMIGVQVGGAVKNILAIAAGLLDGLDMGYNIRAAMLTRGLAEMSRYARALGGKATTVCGLSGMGDLLLTSTSALSRNYRFGQLVGRGVPVHEAKLRLGTVEGLITSRILTVQAQAHGIDLAIISAIDGILHGDVTPLKAIEYLMQRPRVQEFEA